MAQARAVIRRPWLLALMAGAACFCAAFAVGRLLVLMAEQEHAPIELVAQIDRLEAALAADVLPPGDHDRYAWFIPGGPEERAGLAPALANGRVLVVLPRGARVADVERVLAMNGASVARPLVIWRDDGVWRAASMAGLAARGFGDLDGAA